MEYFQEGTPQPGPKLLEPTEFLDFGDPAVGEFACRTIAGAESDIDKAVKLYYAVRDTIRYDPYRVSLNREIYKASAILSAKAGFCLPKANLLAATARAAGIPSAIGLSDVVNHLCTERLLRFLGGKELFIDHGYAVLYIGSKWVKASPAFNISLCERFGVRPTEFDGKSDALLQPFDAKGRRHMEYVRNHGIWTDFPFERVIRDFRAYYPEDIFHRIAGGAATAEFEKERPLTT